MSVVIGCSHVGVANAIEREAQAEFTTYKVLNGFSVSV
jgi:metal-dependent hydrolase (beta-lactamase superfamily II)